MTGQKLHPFILWVIWSSMFLMLFVYQEFLDGGIQSGTNAESPDIPFQALCLGVILIATVIRWLIIPKVKDNGSLLLLMIIGISMAEAAQLFQIFLIGSEFPETKMSIFILSILGVGQFAPFYANRTMPQSVDRN